MSKSAKTILVSFTPEDESFASGLVTRLMEHLPNVKVHSCSAASAGRSWIEIISLEATGEHIFTVVLSPGYLASELAQQELTKATQRALEGELRLVPVMRTECQPQGLVGILASIDFTENADFEQALRQLINGISAERPHGAEPGLVRRNIHVKELTSNVLHLIDKEVLPTNVTLLAPVRQSDLKEDDPRTIFLSYASRDRGFVASLTDLIAQRLPGVRLRLRLFEPHPPAFWETIAQEFRECDVFLAVLSPEYLANPATQKELGEATRLVLCGHGRLVPVMRRPCNPGGFIGMLEPAHFTDAAMDASSVDDLIAGILGSGTERIEPGEVRPGLTINEIGRVADEINRTNRRLEMEQKVYLKNLKPEERNIIQRDIVDEINATLTDIHTGVYDQELKEGGIENAKELLPQDSPWTIRSGQQLTGLEIALITLVAKEGVRVTGLALTDLWTKIVFPRIKQRWGSRISETPD